MNLNKSREFFDPEFVSKEDIHILGCGAVGSTIAENLTRMGVYELHLWDFDEVDEHNIANQMFLAHQIHHPKTEAVEEICKLINPDIIIHKHGKYEDESLTGYLFLCFDSIKARRAVLESNIGNNAIIAVFEGRMRLTDAQHFASNWTTLDKRRALLATMDFSDDEAKDSTPISACGTTLSVVFTVRCLVSLMVANFAHFVRKGQIHKMMTLDLETFAFEAFLDK